jgi:glycosyltransferase involved in cell wall biosynthesis/GT2 family glycosyltransferase
VRALRVSHSAAVDDWRGRERALRALGVDVTLLSARRSHEGAGLVALTPRDGERVTGVATLGTHPAVFLYDPRPIWRALGERVDVIDIHEEPFALATAEVLLLRRLRGNRAPVVLYTAQNLRKRYPIPFRWFERWALHSASGISACNREAADIVAAKGFAGRARVIPLGIDPLRFHPAAAPAVRAAAGPVVGFIGRLVPEKGVEVLLEALQHDDGLRARFAGTGPLASTLLQRAAEIGVGDRVELVGSVPPEAVVEFYRSVDVIAVPSLSTPRWTEQFGRVAVEAMACGVPVVASNAGALPDVVAGAGIVVPEADANALAIALSAAAGPRREELREAGLSRAAECTWDSVARDYVDLYHSVLHETTVIPETRPVEIIVVAYGAPGLLRDALEPVREFAVTVVDNSSLPEIAALCAELDVHYIDAGGNRGFAAGVNLGLAHRQLPGADILLLNPDARIESDQIAPLQARLLAEPDVASVAPTQTDEHGHPARVEWPFPTPANAWREAIGLGRRQRGARFVIGSVLLLRAEALAQLGGMDERFFLYAEETDWAYRAHRLGWRHRVAGDVHAVHVGAGTSSDARRREAHFHASQERYYRKHFGTLGWQATRAAVWTGAVARSLILPGERGEQARRRAALYRRGPVRVESGLRTASAVG